jgi:pilus assembly protein CpaC
MNVQQKTVLFFISAIIIIVFAISAHAEQEGIPITVPVNKGTVLNIKEPSKRVSISNPEIAELNLISPTEVLINGKKIGNTTLIVWDEQGRKSFFDIRVTDDTTSKMDRLSEFQEHIKEIAPNDNIRAELAGDTIVLSGNAKNQQTIDKVVRLAQAYAVGSEVKTTTTFAGGVATESSEASGKVINQISVENAQQVVLEVRVAHVDKSKLKELGISTLIKGRDAEGFTNLVGAPSGVIDTDNFIGPGISTHGEGITGTMPGLAGIKPLDPFQIGVSYFPGGIGVVLKALTTKGLAKVIAEPNLTVRSGEKGRFHVGTRFPVQVVTGTGGDATASIRYEEIGIRLNFAPEVLETEVVRLKIDPAEVSSITDFIRLQNLVAPIIDTRTVSTSVDLKPGESLILAGLLSDEMKKNIRKVPLLGDIPIFGALFRSTTDELRERELVFFITPRMVAAIPQGIKTELPGEKPLTPEQEREFQWIP